jgi:hypothetical protein
LSLAAALIDAEAVVDAIEDLICELLSPPICEGRAQILPFNTVSSEVTHSLPVATQLVVRDLQALPFPFCDQKVETKRTILIHLVNARQIAERMTEELHELQMKAICGKGSVRRIKSEIDMKVGHLTLLSNAMRHFRLH